MATIQIPEIIWSEWKIWSERDDIPDVSFPGIYRLAIGRAGKLDGKNGYDRVRYIGMSLRSSDPESSKKTGLRQRWYELDRALKGLRGHSGGNRMFAEYGALVGDRFPGKGGSNTLYVSAMPFAPRLASTDIYIQFSPTQLREDGIICYLEYESFAQYSEALPNNRRPKFNIK